MTPNDQLASAPIPTNPKETTQLERSRAAREFDELLGFALQSALEEVAEYTRLIETAKTQAKRDFYKKKIAKVTKRLGRVIPRPAGE